MITYKQLSIEHKLEVVQRFIEFNVERSINYALGKTKYEAKYPNVECFFESQCLDLHPDTSPYAYRHSKRCYYCETEFDNSQERKKTYDHFVPKQYRHLYKCNKMVIACYNCNHTKGCRHPKKFISKLRKKIGNSGYTVARVEKILFDLENDIGPRYYFLT